MMTVKNEVDWVAKSILSVKDAVDEIVLVDNGSVDGTLETVKELKTQLGPKLRYYSYPEEDYCGAVNFNLNHTTYQWILRWHGDFIARTNGPLSIAHLRDRLAALDRRRYFCVWIGPVSLDGDLFHQIPEREVELEPLAYVYSPSLRYNQVGRFETLHVPWYYKRLEWRQLHFFHMRYVKPSRSILYRYFWTEWMSLGDKSRFPNLDSYVRHRILEEYGTSDIDQAMRQRVIDLGKELVPYDRSRYGDYPAILAEDLERPKYRLIWRDGKVVGRSDLPPAGEPDKESISK